MSKEARMIIYVYRTIIILTCLAKTEEGWADDFQLILYEDAEVVSTNLIQLERKPQSEIAKPYWKVWGPAYGNRLCLFGKAGLVVLAFKGECSFLPVQVHTCHPNLHQRKRPSQVGDEGESLFSKNTWATPK